MHFSVGLLRQGWQALLAWSVGVLGLLKREGLAVVAVVVAVVNLQLEALGWRATVPAATLMPMQSALTPRVAPLRAAQPLA